MNRDIINLTEKILNSEFIQQILNGELDNILSIDMEDIVERFNAGEDSVLEDEKLQWFLNSGKTASNFINVIMRAKQLLSYKRYIHSRIHQLKNNMEYSPDAYFVKPEYYGHGSATYGEILKAMEIAQNLLNNSKVYSLLRFYLKYDSLYHKIVEVKAVLKKKNIPSETREKFLALLSSPDYEVGIVRIDDTENGVSVKAGTKKDMEISDLIGLPFERDMDREGYYYGPYGDYYAEPRKVVKTFHTEDLTDKHKRMIIGEKASRLADRLLSTDEIGYINLNKDVIVVSRYQLCKAGINPESVGWKPMTLVIVPETVDEIMTSFRIKTTKRERLGLKTGLLLKGRK